MNTFHKLMSAVLLLTVLISGVRAQSVFVKELIYDSTIMVDGKFENAAKQLIELAGPAGTDLSKWSIVLYDGTENNRVAVAYHTRKLTGVIPDQENGFGTLAFEYPAATFKNGPSDGIAVVDADGKVVQLISYEGSFTAGSGPAKGMVADNSRVSHSGTDGNESLQMRGTGSVYKDFKWSGLYKSTPGEINTKFINDKQKFRRP